MSTQLIHQSFLIFLLASLLSACNTTSKEPTVVKISKPRAYNKIPADRLGVNEAGKGLSPGTQIENVDLHDIEGREYDLVKAWREKPALIVFYRGGWCPYCNMQVRELSQNYAKLSAAGVQPVLISVDEPDKTALLSATYRLPFPVLSDSELAAHKQFNVVLQLDDVTLEKYRGYGIDLAEWSGHNHHAIAVASVFLVDQQGRVLMSHALSDYSARPSIDQLLEMIDRYVK